MKITEYPETKILDTDDVFLIDGGGSGTRTIKVEDSYLAQVEAITEEPWVVHRNTFRGKNLGTSFTDEQKAHIVDGTFKDLYVGDYWEIDGNKWRIADINYWSVGKYNPALTYAKNHLVIIPDEPVLEKVTYCDPNGDKNTTNGYGGSYLHTHFIPIVNAKISEIFGSDNIYSHYAYLSNNNTFGVGNAGAWFYDIKALVPNQAMIMGNNYLFDATIDAEFSQPTDSFIQMSLFRLNPTLIRCDTVASYILQDIFGERLICMMNSNRLITIQYSLYEAALRPVFGIA